MGSRPRDFHQSISSRAASIGGLELGRAPLPVGDPVGRVAQERRRDGITVPERQLSVALARHGAPTNIDREQEIVPLYPSRVRIWFNSRQGRTGRPAGSDLLPPVP